MVEIAHRTAKTSIVHMNIPLLR